MPDNLPMYDGERYIAKLEEAVERGDADLIERNMPRLEELIAKYQDRIYRLAQLQYRARLIRERHEPSAEKRGLQRKRGS